MKSERLGPSETCCFEFELIMGEKLKGDILSNSQIDIYLVTNDGFSKWMNDEVFDHECCHESITRTTINYQAPREGTWYLLVENNGKKTAEVEVILEVSS